MSNCWDFTTKLVWRLLLVRTCWSLVRRHMHFSNVLERVEFLTVLLGRQTNICQFIKEEGKKWITNEFTKVWDSRMASFKSHPMHKRHQTRSSSSIIFFCQMFLFSSCLRAFTRGSFGKRLFWSLRPQAFIFDPNGGGCKNLFVRLGSLKFDQDDSQIGGNPKLTCPK